MIFGNLLLFQEEVFSGFLVQEILREYHRLKEMLSRGDGGEGERSPVMKQEQREEEGDSGWWALIRVTSRECVKTFVDSGMEISVDEDGGEEWTEEEEIRRTKRPKVPKRPVPLLSEMESPLRKRGVRCMECPACLRADDCGKCSNCK